MSTMYRHWTDLIKPKKLEVEEKTLTSTYGRFYAEPFERGFGQTIGNSLRRILLSSLMGGSIVAVRIKNILHEFSTIAGVTEDVADIILNLKEVRLRLNESEQQTLKIEAKGPGIVCAKDIIAPPAVEILNPDHKIATLSRDAKLEMEMLVKLGRGYVPAERNKEEGAPVDTIFIDAVFCTGAESQFHRDQRASRPTHGLRPADLRGAHRRQRQAGRRDGLRRENPAGPGQHLTLTSKKSRARKRATMARRSRSTTICSAASTSSSSRCARKTACRTPTSSILASWCRRASRRCSRRRTSAINR